MKRETRIALVSAAAAIAAIGWTLSRPARTTAPAAPSSADTKASVRRDAAPGTAAPRSSRDLANTAEPAAALARTNAEASLQALRSRFTDPAQASAELRKIRAGIEQTKGRLFQRLGTLPPEKLEQLKSILTQTEFERRRAMLPTSVQPTAAEQQAMAAAAERLVADRQRQVSELLGPDGYASYAAYERAEPFRNTLEQIANTMRSRGAAVSGDQQEALLDAYVAAFGTLTHDPAASPGTALAAGPAQQMQPWSRFDEALAEKAAAILPPAQLKLFMDAQYAQENDPAH